MVGILVRGGVPRVISAPRPRFGATGGRFRPRAAGSRADAAAGPLLRLGPALAALRREGLRPRGPRLLGAAPGAGPRAGRVPAPRPRRHAGAPLRERRLPFRRELLHALRGFSA